MGDDVPRSSALFTASDLYAPPQHVDPRVPCWMPSQAILAALRGESMQDPANELLRTPLLGTRVNKASKALCGIHGASSG